MKCCLVVGLIITLVLYYCTAGNVDDIQWTNSAVLDKQHKYKIFWTAGVDDITIKVIVATKGYVGFGISPNGGMQGSDIVVGWISSGQTYFYDCYGEEKTRPKKDSSQDWELLQGYENDSHTSFTFRRKLDTCDDKDFPINDDTSRVIFAYHPEDPGSLKDIAYHGLKNRGTRSLIFLQSKAGYELKENVSAWDVRSPNFTISKYYDSIYWCSVQKSPPLREKHHVIKVESLVQEGNEAFIHHVVLYRCLGSQTEGEKYVNGMGHQCYDHNMPIYFSSCAGMYAAWGIGGEGMILPKDAGLPLGGGEEIYFLLEVHYDNPALRDGVVDTSGLRLYYTDKLRKYDAMTMMIGASVHKSVIIPPRQKDFIVAGHGNPDCLGPVMPKEGVKVVSVFLHAHLLGRKIIARHFRNNTELPPLAVDDNYDFNYQAYRHLKDEVTLLPTDHVVVECTYDSTGRSVTTFGGLSTKEEMCIAFILYYPRIAISGSLSGPSLELVMALTGIRYLDGRNMEVIRSPISLQNTTYMEYLMVYPWTPRYVELVENVLRYAPQTTNCYKGNGLIEMPRLIMYPTVQRIYEKKRKCSKVSATPLETGTSSRITSPGPDGKSDNGASISVHQNTAIILSFVYCILQL